MKGDLYERYSLDFLPETKGSAAKSSCGPGKSLVSSRAAVISRLLLKGLEKFDGQACLFALLDDLGSDANEFPIEEVHDAVRRLQAADLVRVVKSDSRGNHTLALA
jgi:hypothetical protein